MSDPVFLDDVLGESTPATEPSEQKPVFLDDVLNQESQQQQSDVNYDRHGQPMYPGNGAVLPGMETGNYPASEGRSTYEPYNPRPDYLEPVQPGWANRALTSIPRALAAGVGKVDKSVVADMPLAVLNGLTKEPDMSDVNPMGGPRVAAYLGNKIISTLTGKDYAKAAKDELEATSLRMGQKVDRFAGEQNVGEKIISGIPNLAAMIGLGVASGGSTVPAAVMGMAGYGEAKATSKDQMLKAGLSPEDAEQRSNGIAAVTGAVDIVLGKVGLENIMKVGPVKEVFERTLMQKLKELAVEGSKSAGFNGLVGVVQSVVDDLVNSIGQGDPKRLEGMLGRALESGVVGAIQGGAAHVAMGAPHVKTPELGAERTRTDAIKNAKRDKANAAIDAMLVDHDPLKLFTEATTPDVKEREAEHESEVAKIFNELVRDPANADMLGEDLKKKAVGIYAERIGTMRTRAGFKAVGDQAVMPQAHTEAPANALDAATKDTAAVSQALTTKVLSPARDAITGVQPPYPSRDTAAVPYHDPMAPERLQQAREAVQDPRLAETAVRVPEVPDLTKVVRSESQPEQGSANPVTPSRRAPNAEAEVQALPSKTSVYHETSPQEAHNFLPTDKGAHGGANANVFVADHPSLALGQGANRGVKMEFDRSALTLREHTAKPGLDIVKKAGGGAEYIANNNYSDYQQALKKVEYPTASEGPNNGRLNAVQAMAKKLKDAGFIKHVEGGTTTWTKPEAKAKIGAPKPVVAENATTEKPKVTGFKTSKGSTYKVDSEGRTQRNKTMHEGHEKGDVGVKDRSEKTFYLPHKDAQELGMHQQLMGKTGVLIREGRAIPVAWNDKENKWGVSASQRGGFALTDKPAVGVAPLELWKQGTDGVYRNWHPGNEIVEVSHGSKVGPRGKREPSLKQERLTEIKYSLKKEEVERLQAKGQAAIKDVVKARGNEGEEISPEDAKQMFDEAAKKPPRPAKAEEAKSLDIAQMYKDTVPGVKITKDKGGSTYVVEFPNGVKIRTGGLDHIKIEGDILNEYPEDQRALLKAAGSWQLLGDGARKTYDIVGMLKLANDLATNRTLGHELVHMARDGKMWTPEEWSALDKEYRKPGMTDAQVEEAIAKGYENWDGPRQKGLLTKLVDWFKQTFNGVKPNLTSDDVFKLMKDVEFWKREYKVGKEGKKALVNIVRDPNLANPATTPEARAFYNKADAAREEAGKPGYESREGARTEGEALYRKSPAKFKDVLLKAGETGRNLEGHEVYAAKLALEEAAQKALKTNSLNDRLEATALFNAYRDTGTSAARALGARRDDVLSPAERIRQAVIEGLFEPPPEKYSIVKPELYEHLGAHEREAKIKADKEKERAENEKMWAEKLPSLIEQLKAVGFDPAKLDRFENTQTGRLEAGKYLRMIEQAKATKWDKLMEWRIASMLSGPATHAKNFVSNSAMQAWHFNIERRPERAITAMMKAFGLDVKDAAQWGEQKYAFPLWESLKRGGSNALLTMKTELPAYEFGATNDPLEALKNVAHHKGGAIGGTFGRVVRLPLTMLQAADQFAKTITAMHEVGQQAARIGMERGHTGEQLDKFVLEQINNPDSTAWDRAHTQAKKLAFQEDLTGIAKDVEGWRKKSKLLAFELPFMKTAVNILKQGLQRAPIVSAGKLALDVRQGIKTGDYSKVPASAAKTLVAHAITAAFYALTDPEDPFITGAADKANPYSVRFSKDGPWHSYAGIEPFATSFGVMADFLAALHSKEPNEAKAKQLGSAFLDQLENKTFLKTVGDGMKVFRESGVSGKTLEEMALDQTASFMPNAYRAGVRSSRDELPERGLWGHGQERVDRDMRRLRQKVELFGGETKYDTWGRPREASSAGDNWMLRMINPVPSNKAEVLDVQKAINKFNTQYPSKGLSIHPPAREFTIHDKATGKSEKRSLSDAEYAAFSKRSGDVAQQVASKFTWDTKNPTEQDAKTIHEIVNKARGAVEKAMIAEFSGKQFPFNASALATQIKAKITGEAFTKFNNAKNDDDRNAARNILLRVGIKK